MNLPFGKNEKASREGEGIPGMEGWDHLRPVRAADIL